MAAMKKGNQGVEEHAVFVVVVSRVENSFLWFWCPFHYRRWTCYVRGILHLFLFFKND